MPGAKGGDGAETSICVLEPDADDALRLRKRHEMSLKETLENAKPADESYRGMCRNSNYVYSAHELVRDTNAGA